MLELYAYKRPGEPLKLNWVDVQPTLDEIVYHLVSNSLIVTSDSEKGIERLRARMKKPKNSRHSFLSLSPLNRGLSIAKLTVEHRLGKRSGWFFSKETAPKYKLRGLAQVLTGMGCALLKADDYALAIGRMQFFNKATALARLMTRDLETLNYYLSYVSGRSQETIAQLHKGGLLTGMELFEMNTSLTQVNKSPEAQKADYLSFYNQYTNPSIERLSL